MNNIAIYDASIENCEALYCSNKPKQMCSRCNYRRYCSRECQVKDWSKHKEYCSKPEIDTMKGSVDMFPLNSIIKSKDHFEGKELDYLRAKIISYDPKKKVFKL